MIVPVVFKPFPLPSFPIVPYTPKIIYLLPHWHSLTQKRTPTNKYESTPLLASLALLKEICNTGQHEQELKREMFVLNKYRWRTFWRWLRWPLLSTKWPDLWHWNKESCDSYKTWCSLKQQSQINDGNCFKKKVLRQKTKWK